MNCSDWIRTSLLAAAALLTVSCASPDAPVSPALKERMRGPVSLMVVCHRESMDPAPPQPQTAPPTAAELRKEENKRALLVYTGAFIPLAMGVAGTRFVNAFATTSKAPPLPRCNWGDAVLSQFPRAWAAGGSPFSSTGIRRPEKPHADREIHSAAFRATIPAPTLLIVDVRGDGKLHLHWEITDTRSGAVLARSYVDEPLNFVMASSGPQHTKMVRLQHEAIRKSTARMVHQLR